MANSIGESRPAKTAWPPRDWPVRRRAWGRRAQGGRPRMLAAQRSRSLALACSSSDVSRRSGSLECAESRWRERPKRSSRHTTSTSPAGAGPRSRERGRAAQARSPGRVKSNEPEHPWVSGHSLGLSWACRRACNTVRRGTAALLRSVVCDSRL